MIALNIQGSKVIRRLAPTIENFLRVGVSSGGTVLCRSGEGNEDRETKRADY